jgi:hypothetical protein
VHDPYQLAEELLALVVSGFLAAEVDLPNDKDAGAVDYGTQYVAPGLTVAYDGPQVTTNVSRLFHGQPGSEQSTFNPRMPAPLSCDLQVVILRTTPVQQEDGSPPDVDTLQANAQQNVLDLVTLRQILYDVVTKNQLVEQGPPIALNPVVPLGPQGGLVGVAGTISLVIS